MLAGESLIFRTVDTDYGCDVIRRNVSLSAFQRIARRALRMITRDDRADVVRQWIGAGKDYDAAFNLL